MRYPRLFGLLAVTALTACTAKVDATSKTFTPEQRVQIVQIMRDAMKKDPSILRDAIVVVQADNDRLEAQAQHDRVASHQDVLYNANDPFAGNSRATTTIVEFYDPRCPYCRQLEPLLSSFVSKDGNVRLVFKDLPILGPVSEMDSKALLAAARQGRYQALRTAIMRSPDDLTPASLQGVVESLGLDWKRLRRDMDSTAVATELRETKQLAADLGIEGTPTLVIGQKIIEGADMPAIAAAVSGARHDYSRDQSKPTVP